MATRKGAAKRVDATAPTHPVLKDTTKESRAQWTAELGSTGLKRWKGFIDEEFHRDLRGNKDIEKFTEMRANSPIVGASELAISSLLRGVVLRTDAGEESQLGARARDLVDTAFGDMSASWPDTLTEILTMLPFGWAWLEVVYKQRSGDNEDGARRSRFNDGLLGWRGWRLRGQSSLSEFQFDGEGGIAGMVQVDPANLGKQVTIPIEKSALFRTSVEKNNPKGRSVLRPAYLPYYAAQRIMAIEGIGIERDLAGYPVMEVPAEILAAETEETQKILAYLKKMIVNTRRDDQEGALIPLVYDGKGNPLYKFTLMTSGGARQFDTTKVIERYERRIAMAMLCDIVMLGHEKVGSFALADSKQDLLSVALGGWMDAILGVINRHLVPRLLLLNGFPASMPPPVVQRSEIHAPDLQQLGEYIGKLTGAGMPIFPSPDGELERHLLTIGKLPTGSLGPGEVGKRNVGLINLLLEQQAAVAGTMREIQKLVKAARSLPARKRRERAGA